MGGFTQFIEPLEDPQTDVGFDPIAAAAPGQEAVDSAVKDKRRATRGRALEALSMALATFASRDPGRTAAQFIDQAMQRRQRDFELQRNERMIRERQALAVDESAKDRSATAGLQGDRLVHQTGMQDKQLEHGTSERKAGQEYATEAREDNQEFKENYQVREFRNTLNINGIQNDAADKRLGKQISAAQAAATRSMKNEVAQRTMSWMRETGTSVKGYTTEEVGYWSALAVAEEVPFDSIPASIQSAFNDQMAQVALQEQVKQHTAEANLVAMVTELSMLPGAGGVGETFSQERYDAVWKQIHQGVGPAEQLSPDESMPDRVEFDALVAKADGGEELSVSDQLRALDIRQSLGGSPTELQEVADRVGASAGVAAVFLGGPAERAAASTEPNAYEQLLEDIPEFESLTDLEQKGILLMRQRTKRAGRQYSEGVGSAFGLAKSFAVGDE